MKKTALVVAAGLLVVIALCTAGLAAPPPRGLWSRQGSGTGPVRGSRRALRASRKP